MPRHCHFRAACPCGPLNSHVRPRARPRMNHPSPSDQARFESSQTIPRMRAARVASVCKSAAWFALPAPCGLLREPTKPIGTPLVACQLILRPRSGSVLRHRRAGAGGGGGFAGRQGYATPSPAGRVAACVGAPAARPRPNPSLERTSTGVALGPRTGQCHHPLRGPSTTPVASAQLKR